MKKGKGSVKRPRDKDNTDWCGFVDVLPDGRIDVDGRFYTYKPKVLRAMAKWLIQVADWMESRYGG